MLSTLPRLPLGDAVDAAVDWIQESVPSLLDGIQATFNTASETLTDVLLFLPSLVMVLLFGLLGLLVRSWKFAVFAVVGFALIVSLELWGDAMQTLAMVLVATVVAVVIAIPVGILAAKSSIVSAIVRPILDFMQTMPALVYLVPVVIFFSIGFAPGVVATIIFAMAPGVRLTELGIRQVDSETVEAGQAFGGTGGQILRGIQLPLGLPTIMAGVNQVIMLGLSMAVLAGFVGAPGLGATVTFALGRVDVALGSEAGLAIVIIAIFLDRMTGAIGQPTNDSLLAILRRRRQAGVKQRAEAAAAQEEQKEQAEEAAKAGAAV